MGSCPVGSVVDGGLVVSSRKRVERGLIFHDCKSIPLPPGGPDYTAAHLIQLAGSRPNKSVLVPAATVNGDERFALNHASHTIWVDPVSVWICGPDLSPYNPSWMISLYF